MPDDFLIRDLEWKMENPVMDKVDKRDLVELALSAGGLVLILVWTVTAWVVLVP